MALTANRPAAAGSDAPAVERITKTVHVRASGSGSGSLGAPRERTLRQLSGGERRCVASSSISWGKLPGRPADSSC